MSARFALVRGRELTPIAEIKANGRTVSSIHELAHVVQQRGCQLTFLVEDSQAPGRQRTIVGGFKSVAGMDSETELVDQSVAGVRVPLTGFTSSPSSPAAYFPGATKYSTVKLSRAAK